MACAQRLANIERALDQDFTPQRPRICLTVGILLWVAQTLASSSSDELKALQVMQDSFLSFTVGHDTRSAEIVRDHMARLSSRQTPQNLRTAMQPWTLHPMHHCRATNTSVHHAGCCSRQLVRGLEQQLPLKAINQLIQILKSRNRENQESTPECRSRTAQESWWMGRGMIAR